MKKTVLLIIITGLFLACEIMAQTPGDTLWTRTYGGTEVDFASSSQQTSDGGFILGGYTNSFGVGNNDFYLIKTDSFGDTLWTKTYGGIQSDCGHSVKQTTDDGFIIAGSTRSFSESLDFYVIKTDVNGNTMWSHTYGGPNTFEEAYSIIQVNDGGYVISGYYDLIDDFMSPNDFFVVRTDAIGDTLWTKKYGSVDIDETALSVQQTSDEGLIIVGNSINYQTMDFLIWLVKTDSNGETLWTQTYLETGYDMMWGSSVQITSEDGFIIAGYAMSFELGADAYATKTDSLGNIIWAKTYGGTQNDFAFSAQQTTDNGYIICGHTGSFGAEGQDIYLIKTDASGDTLWTRTYGGTQNDEGVYVCQTAENDYIIVGSTESFGAGNYDMWLLRIYDITTGIENENILAPSIHNLSQNNPNPFNTKTTIHFTTAYSDKNTTITIYNFNGQKIKTLVDKRLSAGTHQIVWDGTDYSGNAVSSGIYFYKMECGDRYTGFKKMILMK